MNDFSDPLEKQLEIILTVICNELSDAQLIILQSVVLNDRDPREQTLIFDYEQVKPLFTEAGGTQMHSAFKEVLDAYVIRRLSWTNTASSYAIE